MDIIHPSKKLDEIVKQLRECDLTGLRIDIIRGKLLREVREGNLWISSEANSFFEWAEREVHYKHQQTRNFIHLYEKFDGIIKAHPELAATQPTRLIQCIPHIETEDDALTQAHYALELNPKDWEDHLRVLSGKTPTDECNHDWEMGWKKCKLCPKFSREVNNGT
jgi:hypothetical protein